MENVSNETVQAQTTNNSVNSAKLTALQKKKLQLEDKLKEHNAELRKLCVQEAELTGQLPQEYPLEPGESPPYIRRRIGTSYAYPPTLINKLNNDDDEAITALETKIQVQKNIVKAALALTQDPHKTVRKKNLILYNQTSKELQDLEDKLAFLKSARKTQYVANVTNSTSSVQLKQRKKPRPESEIEKSESTDREPRRVLAVHKETSAKDTEQVTTSVSRLTVTSYSERRANGSRNRRSSNPSPGGLSVHHSPYATSPPAVSLQQSSQIPAQYLHVSAVQLSPTAIDYPSYTHSHLVYPPPPALPHHSAYAYSPTGHSPHAYHQYQAYSRSHTPTHLKPHQQYEHVMGLGGYWARADNGEVFWYSGPAPYRDPYQATQLSRDKRFGSLDRRRARRLQHRVPSQSETVFSQNLMAPVSPTMNVSTVPRKTANKIDKSSNRQLIRTQSLGSVEVWHDGTQSENSDHLVNIEETELPVHKPKQKGWCETSLDTIPLPPKPSAKQLASWPKPTTQVDEPPVPPPTTKPLPSPSKLPKEIPAESNPHQTSQQDNISAEFYNNNVTVEYPKNWVVQAGHCKPYREETKPFEMSDCYKYSKKFRDQQNQLVSNRSSSMTDESVDQIDSAIPNVIQKGLYQPLKPHQCHPVTPPQSSKYNNLSSPTTEASLPVSNMVENYPSEVSAWYQNQRSIDNNNQINDSRSTATLV